MINLTWPSFRGETIKSNEKRPRTAAAFRYYIYIVLFCPHHPVDSAQQRVNGGGDNIGMDASPPADLAVFASNADIGAGP